MMVRNPHNPAVSFYKELIVSRQLALAVFAENCNRALATASSLDATAYAARRLRCNTRTLRLTCA